MSDHERRPAARQASPASGDGPARKRTYAAPSRQEIRISAATEFASRNAGDHNASIGTFKSGS